MQFLQVKYGTEKYLQSLLLRYKVLRVPLQLEFSVADFEKDKKDIHLCIFDDEKIVATCTFTQIATTRYKMRQVAVDTAIQQQGIGKKLIAFAEKFAKENGVTQIECNARETAVPFYQKMKYEVVGAPFLEVGIPHFFMHKEL